jgi:hypothetical protein
MIGISIKGVKSEGRGQCVGNGWHDTDDVAEAITAELERFHRMWDALGHGAPITYVISVAPESSPRRTQSLSRSRHRLPLPVTKDAAP